MAEIKIEASWKRVLAAEFQKPYFDSLVDFLKSEYVSQKVYPSGKNIFKAFDTTPLSNVKVVILGQDPYHGPGQANGLCFSVSQGVALPPSLLNIFKEINRDLGHPVPRNGDLTPWAMEGVMLLNATLTVRAHEAGSHQNRGWERFSDAVISVIDAETSHTVFMLWGSFARKKAALIDQSKHLVLESPHPSPLSAHRGFIGNGHFRKANDYLVSNGIEPVYWAI